MPKEKIQVEDKICKKCHFPMSKYSKGDLCESCKLEEKENAIKIVKWGIGIVATVGLSIIGAIVGKAKNTPKSKK